MRRFVLLSVSVAALCLLTTASASAAAPRWSWSDPFPGIPLNGVTFPDSTHGWVCGAGGLVAVTGDGGNTWKPQDSATGVTLNDIQFCDLTDGWAATADGRVLRTSNGGQTWIAVTVDPTYGVSEVDFVDSRHGWAATAAGPYVTTDGGQSWSLQTIVAPTVGGSAKIAFCDRSNGWYLNYLDSYYTHDGGATWTSLMYTKLADVACPAPAGSFVTNGASVLYWDFIDPGDDYYQYAGDSVCSLEATDTQHAWAGSSSGGISATADGGNTWYAETVQGTHAVRDLSVLGEEAWACGDGVYYTTRSGYSGLHPPVTTSDAPRYANHDVIVTLSVTDTGNDVTGTFHRVGTGAWLPGVLFTIPAPADHTGDGPVEFGRYSTDAAGNDEVPVQQTVFVDTQIPSVDYGCQDPYQWGYWTNRNVGVWVAASDPDPSSGAAGEMNLGDGQGWFQTSYSAAIVARKDHSNDGVTTVSFRAEDNAANISAVERGRVYIDTRRPTAAAPYVAHARTGGTGSFVCKVIDARPCSGVCAITINVYHSGVLIGRLIPDGWFPSNRLVTVRFKCPLKPGSYRFKVKGGDGAGNVTPVAAANTLVVTRARGSAARASAEQASGLTPWSPVAAPGVLGRSAAAAAAVP